MLGKEMLWNRTQPMDVAHLRRSVALSTISRSLVPVCVSVCLVITRIVWVFAMNHHMFTALRNVSRISVRNTAIFKLAFRSNHRNVGKKKEKTNMLITETIPSNRYLFFLMGFFAVLSPSTH